MKTGWRRAEPIVWLAALTHPEQKSEPDGERPLRLRWVMIGFAFLATVINYLDRQAPCRRFNRTVAPQRH
jgi:hypothetical protein